MLLHNKYLSTEFTTNNKEVKNYFMTGYFLKTQNLL